MLKRHGQEKSQPCFFIYLFCFLTMNSYYLIIFKIHPAELYIVCMCKVWLGDYCPMYEICIKSKAKKKRAEKRIQSLIYRFGFFAVLDVNQSNSVLTSLYLFCALANRSRAFLYSSLRNLEGAICGVHFLAHFKAKSL